MKLNKDQKKLTAEILGNISVAWFAVGVIPLFFVKNLILLDSIRYFLLGIFMCLVFFLLAINILKR